MAIEHSLAQADPTGVASPALTDEDHLRACVYRLLARFLAVPPDAEALRIAAGLDGDDTEFGRALRALAKTAGATEPRDAKREYDELFIGLVRGELVPYASFYRTGFLHERPLAAVRADLGRLGVARDTGWSDPEDHIAGLCEAMAGLIEGRFGDGGLAGQRGFFDRHLAPWAGKFFTDLERARASRLYAPLGTVGRVFLDIETTAYAMAA
jgi:TorA maturation chaperone TorD